MNLIYKSHPYLALAAFLVGYPLAYFTASKLLRTAFARLAQAQNAVGRSFSNFVNRIVPLIDILVDRRAGNLVTFWMLISFILFLIRDWLVVDLEAKTVVMAASIIPIIAMTAAIVQCNPVARTLSSHWATKVSATLVLSALFWLGRVNTSDTLDRVFGIEGDVMPAALYAGTFLWVIYAICAAAIWTSNLMLLAKLVVQAFPFQGRRVLGKQNGAEFFFSMSMLITSVMFLDPLRSGNVRETLVVSAAVRHDFVENFRCMDTKPGDRALFLGSPYDRAMLIHPSAVRTDLLEVASSKVPAPMVTVRGIVACNQIR
ncbi:hypothetical protein [Burkholderia gladioli]|uniref:hypothetical protein n=1 Tax=Burkholderia gladioli TaxID=28095 RepID=UPI001641953F|nr:hypothetical protein [Burkholderia gladioli]